MNKLYQRRHLVNTSTDYSVRTKDSLDHIKPAVNNNEWIKPMFIQAWNHILVAANEDYKYNYTRT